MTQENERLLIIDDDDTIRKVIALILQKKGYSIETACDLTEAVKIYREAIEFNRPFSFLIIDYTLPDHNGAEILKRFKEINLEKKVITEPIAILSSARNFTQEYKAMGFHDFLPKPFDTNGLSSILKKNSSNYISN